jgi:hypothetical protein
MSDFDHLPLAARLRHDQRAIAVSSLEALDPKDAATIAAAVLDVVGAGDPRLDPWSDLRADAEFWADCANPAELEVYFASALKRLKNQSLGIHARKRLFWAIWVSLSVKDQQSFLCRATAKEAAA